jgi:glycogen synthase
LGDREGLLSAGDLEIFNKDVERAVETGLRRSLEGVAPDAMITEAKIERNKGEFLPFEPIFKVGGRSIVIVSREYPPENVGGIATFSKDLAESLGALGNIVHVITQSRDINRVDFENGVWVHRMVVREIDRPREVNDRNIPQHIWNWSATALGEAKRIATHRKIDVVEAPIWDCEGVAFLISKQWPLVTSLHTTLHFWLESHPDKRADSGWMNAFLAPMISLERELMTQAEGVRANSQAIITEIERAYGFKFTTETTKVVPHGLGLSHGFGQFKINCGVQILFVGRLEPRKGIDILLQAIPEVIKEIPEINFRIIGDNSLAGPDGMSFMDKFYFNYAGEKWLSKVRFEGRVDQDILLSAYSACDIFVAPSRFESFGLIFLEAMREGKPVIGCAAGGMPEVVSNEVNGLLVEPGNVRQLAEAILKLATNPDLRLRMGAAGRKIFEEKFTAKRMAEESFSLYDLARTNFAVTH